MVAEHHKIGDFVVLGDDILGSAGLRTGFRDLQRNKKLQYGLLEAGAECR
jgi:hypothetical protein